MALLRGDFAEEGVGLWARGYARVIVLSRGLLLVAVVAAVSFCIGVVFDLSWVRPLVKPVPVLALAVWVAREGRAAGGYRRWVVAGLLASAAGDVLLEVDPRRLFVAGLAAFLVAHVLYVLAYRSDARQPALIRALPAYAYGAVMLAALWPGLGAMRVPVCAYTAVICTMLWRAGARVGVVEPGSAWLALAGAVSFAASDSMIALARFGAHLPWADLRTGSGWRLAIMTTYWLGQWGIAASAMPHRRA